MKRLPNESWKLQSFIDSLVVELDKARDSLAVKALNQPLSYSVKDLSLDLQVFPEYDGDEVHFKTAKPGEEGASKISMELVSTSDRAIRESSRPPAKLNEGKLDNIPGVDGKKKKALEKIGVRTVKDIERIQENNVNLEQVTDGQIDYKALAGIIQRSRRGERPPLVRGVSLAQTADGDLLSIDGKNLSIFEDVPPIAFFNGQAVSVLKAEQDKILLRLPELVSRQMAGQQYSSIEPMMHIVLEPDTIIKFRVRL